MRRNSRGVLIAVLLVLAVLACGFAYYAYATDQAERAMQAEIAATVRRLENQRSEKQAELDALEEEYNNQVADCPTAQILFLGADTPTYLFAYPILEARGIAGMLAFNASDLPGSSGNMTMEEFQELTGCGWEYCVTFTGDEDWMDLMNSALDSAELTMPSTIFFLPGGYSRDADEYLDGFDTIIHHGEDNLPLIAGDPEAPFWRIGALTLPQLRDAMDKVMDEAAEAAGNLVLVVNLAKLDNPQEMAVSLGDMVDYYRQSGFQFCTLSEARARRTRSASELAALEAEFSQAAEVIRGELAELDQQLRYYNGR